MAVLEPKLAILDETDSGLDIDALKIVADGVNALRAPERAIIVVTHYQRLLDYIVPDFVHVLSDGRIVKSGGKELALELEAQGLRLDRSRRPQRGRERVRRATERWTSELARSCRDKLSKRAGSPALEERPQRRAALAAGSARRAARALRRARVPDDARRGVAVHQRRADRGDRVPARAADRRSARPSGRRASPTPTRRSGSSFVNGRFAPTLSRTHGPAGGRRVRLAGRRARRTTPTSSQRYLGQLADFTSRERSPRSTPRSCSDGAFVYVPDGAVLEQPIQILFVSTAPTARPSMSHPRDADRRRRQQPGADRRELRRRRRRDATSPTPSPRSCVGENAVLDHYKVQQESARRVPRRAACTCTRRAARDVLVALVRARRRARPQRRHRVLDGEGARVHAERPLSRRRRAAGRQPHDDRPRQAALRQPRDLQGHPRRHGARRLQRQDHRPAGRAEDRRQADQPDAAAVRRRARSTPSRSSRSSPTT